MKKRKRNKRGELLYKVKVTQVLFSGKVKLAEGNVVPLLLVHSQCACVKMRKGREYLILGHENRDTRRLMISQLSITARWRDVFSRRIAKWQKRLDKRRRQNRRNRNDLPFFARPKKTTRPTAAGGSSSGGSSSVAVAKQDHPRAAGEDGTETGHGSDNSLDTNGGQRGGNSYNSLNLDDLQNGYRHGGRYYSKELAQLHRYNLAALRELLE
ncbi:secreted frizzled-related protein 3-like protein [Plakobranchus ocellatus]|uniref:Secreted frizzled-related protein 3-like protein n=1 Tax=Plakobranchus ocellatus TaxID=259542 RepID=A0AAV4A915_9GAST|nr:secreted frizzled-related protein 3-like protein [Plakobranchus ocellatus]